MGTGFVKQTTITAASGMGSPLAGSTPPAFDLSGGRGARRAEYLLVIFPYGEIRDQLLEEQQQFATEYGLGYGSAQTTTILSGRPAGSALSGNKPHITVAAFQAGEAMEDTLIRWIQRICNRHRSFEITLNNYSGFPSDTIFLRVQDPKPFRELMQQLRAIDDYIRSSGCPPVNLINRPYLSIAGRLTEKVYNKAMPDYSRKTFHGTFEVQELVLLKREHSFDPCKTVNIFRLLPDDGATFPSPAWVLPHL